MVLEDNQKIGILLTGVGLFFTTLGVMLFFDRGLLTIGNLLFLAGVTLVIGFQKTMRFFMQKRKLKGSICFFGGICLVIIGWAFIGILVEIFGFINLFGDFFPFVLAFLRRVPGIGYVLNLPGVKQFVDKFVAGGSLPL